jgi:hypothetical protein
MTPFAEASTFRKPCALPLIVTVPVAVEFWAGEEIDI